MTNEQDSAVLTKVANLPTSSMVGEAVQRDNAYVHQQFEVQVRRSPDAIALEMAGKTLTFRELNEQANRLAHHLRGLGVGPNVLVGVSMQRSFDLIVAIYGILKAGGAYVPLDPTYPVDRLRYMMSAAKVSFLVTHRSCSQLFSDQPNVKVVLSDDHREIIDQQIECDPEPQSADNQLIYVIFTSGSTGQPKAAAVYHRGFANLIDWFIDEFKIDQNDQALLVSSLSFDLTQKNLFAVLIAGGTLHLYPAGPYDISVLAHSIHQHGITLLNCTPSAFYPLIEPLDETTVAALKSLRVVYLGGEPISIPRITPWITHPTCRAEVANTYGPTECTDICGFYRLTRENLRQYDFVPLGRPIHNVQMVIVDSDMALCPIGVSGELCVGGAGIGAGYINDSEMTRVKFVDNHHPFVTSRLLYRTGDQARWHKDGVIEFLGRLDHQVKIRGFRIELPEIERAMESHPKVIEAVVAVKTDSHGGESQLVGCYSTSRSSDSCTVSQVDLRCFLATLLPSHMIPSTFEEFSRFPLSPNGKVDRHAVMAEVNHRQIDATLQPQASNNRLEDQIRNAWSQVLDRTVTGLDDNFFDLGGDSLRLARLHQMLEKILDRKFPLTDLFAHTTLRSMSQHLMSSPDEGNKQNAVVDRARLQREARMAQRRNRS
jgi:amino acid adenylation domain-containing protein